MYSIDIDSDYIYIIEIEYIILNIVGELINTDYRNRLYRYISINYRVNIQLPAVTIAECRYVYLHEVNTHVHATYFNFSNWLFTLRRCRENLSSSFFNQSKLSIE